MEYLFKLLLIAPKCLNGGERTMQGKCRCPKYFSGDNCGIVECINGGRLSPTNNSVCVCSDAHYRGSHCEIVQCENGGIENGYGGCDCLTNWYTGKFCQFYSSSWSILFGCLGLLLLLALVYIACRWYCSFFNGADRPRCGRVRALTARPEDASFTYRGVSVNRLNVATNSSLPPLTVHLGKPSGRTRTPGANGKYFPAAETYPPESPPPSYEEVTRMSLLLEQRGAAPSSSAQFQTPAASGGEANVGT